MQPVIPFPQREAFFTSVNSQDTILSFGSASEVVREALRLLEERDRLKLHHFAEVQKEIAIGLKQIEEGRVKPFDAEQVKSRVRKQIRKSRKK